MSFTSTGSGKIFMVRAITDKEKKTVYGHSITLNGTEQNANANCQIWKRDFSDKDYPIKEEHLKEMWKGQTSPYTLSFTDCPITTYKYQMNITLKPNKFEMKG